MKHASEETLNQYASLLGKLDTITGLTKKKLGIYYVKSKAFLHFHEDKGQLFADVRLDPPEFNRIAATTHQEQEALIALIKKHQDADLTPKIKGNS